jgi:hypothetical protein
MDGLLFDQRRGIMAGKMARKKQGTARARASVTKTEIAAVDAQVPVTLTPETLAASEPQEAAPCTRSHIPNARTRKALRDADAGKNLTRYPDEDELFRKLGIELGQDEA